MRELTVTETNVVSGGMQFDEAGFGAVLIGAGYAIASITGVGLVVAGVGLVTGFAGGFLVGDGLINNGHYVKEFDEDVAIEEDM